MVRPMRTVLPEVPESCFLVEPMARGTCPVLAWAAREIAAVDPEAVLVSLHSDHLIRPMSGFAETVQAAIGLAREDGLLVTLGVVPDRIETGFGHIQLGNPIPRPGGIEAFRVAAFHEKPSAAVAKRYVRRGFLWNSGIFVWKASVFLEELARRTPEVAGPLTATAGEPPASFFERVPNCVIDTALLERSERVGCVKAQFAWDDVGSWEALARVRDPDAAGNVVQGPGTVVDGKGNIVFAEGGRVVVYGAEHLVVVRTGEVTLVATREHAADLKSLLRTLGEET